MKYILHCEPKDIILAGRAARLLQESDLNQSAVYLFDAIDIEFHCVKNRSGSITVWAQEKDTTPSLELERRK